MGRAERASRFGKPTKKDLQVYLAAAERDCGRAQRALAEAEQAAARARAERDTERERRAEAERRTDEIRTALKQAEDGWQRNAAEADRTAKALCEAGAAMARLEQERDAARKERDGFGSALGLARVENRDLRRKWESEQCQRTRAVIAETVLREFKDKLAVAERETDTLRRRIADFDRRLRDTLLDAVQLAWDDATARARERVWYRRLLRRVRRHDP